MILSPQTPRLKANLSLDIPPSYSSFSNTGTPSAPSSPTTSYVASPVPSSPISGSWNVSKSQAELTSMLKEAYNVIREREKDLTLAAEIGKSLLENNIALKAKYEGAIVQLQHLQRERSKAQTFTLQHQAGDKLAPPIAPPNNSLDTFSEDLEYDESETESLQGWSSSYEQSQQRGASFNRKNHQNSGLNYKDLENLKDLEARNQELQQQLEEVIKEHNDSEKSNKSKIRKLETELQHIQESCTSATQKIDELEKENERLIQKQKEQFWNLKYSKKSDENDYYIDSLLHKVQELEEQNLHIEKARAEIEKKLIQTATESEAIREEYEELIETQKNYEKLQLDHRNQEQLIAELTENLEEQRALVVNYRSGIWSQKTSRANSISGGGISGALRRLSDPDGMNIFGMPQKQNSQDSSGGGIGGKIRKTLLSELENEWFRELTIFQRDVKRGRSDSDVSEPNFMPISSEKDLNDFFIQNGARPDDDMDYLSDDEFSFLDEFDVNDNEKANRLREWFWKRWARAIYRFLRTIWRWCRFIVILIAAVIMALYRGPDDILPEDM